MRVRTGFVVAGLVGTLALGGADPYSPQRERMVREQIEGRGVRDAGVLRAMRATPRHLFVPEGLREAAYSDEPLPIGYGATISQPYIVALMTELLQPAPRHKVLEIGTGSGYQAALLAQLSGHVFTIEIVPELAKSAQATLRRLGFMNVTVIQGDGFKGLPDFAPFDRIILTAAPPEIPQPLVDQLAAGGRLIAPVGGFGVQDLVMLEKDGAGKVTRRSFGAVMFVPMRRGRE